MLLNSKNEDLVVQILDYLVVDPVVTLTDLINAINPQLRDDIRYILRRLREKGIVASSQNLSDMRSVNYRLISYGEFLDLRAKLTDEEIRFFYEFIRQ